MPKPLEIKRLLSKGVHRVDVYAVAHQHAAPHFEVLIDSPEPPFTASIPKDEFSVEKHPAIADAFAVAPATITRWRSSAISARSQVTSRIGKPIGGAGNITSRQVSTTPKSPLFWPDRSRPDRLIFSAWN